MPDAIARNAAADGPGVFGITVRSRPYTRTSFIVHLSLHRREAA
jgi:hypothetical protein